MNRCIWNTIWLPPTYFDFDKIIAALKPLEIESSFWFHVNCRSTLIHSHHRPMMYNTITDQVAVTDINKHQAGELGTTVKNYFISSHPRGIRNTISSKGKTIKSKKHKTATVNDIPVFDVDAVFARQLIVGQKRDISIAQPSVAHQ